MSNFKYIDLFSGIGGFHIALDSVGGECVFACEIDKACRQVYELNFKKSNSNVFKNGMFFEDITKLDIETIPDFDILCAGFPCQPFSQAGYKKGFSDTRGTLFFNIAEIVKYKKPKVAFLENVRGLLKHDGGKTFEVIKNTISSLGYSFHYKLIKACDFNCPQHRSRLYMLCFRDDINDSSFAFPEPQTLNRNMSWVFDGAKVNREIGYTLRVGGKGSPLNDRRNWDGYLVDGVERRVGVKEAMRM